MPVPPCPPASRTCKGLKGARSVFDCAGLLQTSSSSSASRPCSGSQTRRPAVTDPTPALPWPLMPWPLRASPASTAPVQFQQSFRMLLQVHLCPSLQEPHTASLEPTETGTPAAAICAHSWCRSLSASASESQRSLHGASPSGTAPLQAHLPGPPRVVAAPKRPLDGHPRYELICDLFEGTSGIVQLAWDRQELGEVAIKFIERGSTT